MCTYSVLSYRYTLSAPRYNAPTVLYVQYRRYYSSREWYTTSCVLYTVQQQYCCYYTAVQQEWYSTLYSMYCNLQ